MTGHDCGPPDPFALRYPGPFSYHDVVVRGWTVPLLVAHPKGQDRVRIVLDDRLGIDLTNGEAERFIPFVADAIAVAQGFGAHPRGDVEMPPQFPPNSPRRVFDVGPLGPEQAA